MVAGFLSDLHLLEGEDPRRDILLRWLAGPARALRRLYILGDLFETWVGDDDDSSSGEEVAKALAGLAGYGVEIGLIHGNRDFLLGADFARRAGVRLLPDPCVVELAGQAILLSHGDRYCTDDASYQAFRQQVRAPEWQRAFLARPLAERKAYARKARQESADHQRGQPPELGDVVDASVEAELALFGVDRLIHGHTHRPACHRHPVGQRTVERWVLADWREHGEVLVLADDGRLAREVLL